MYGHENPNLVYNLLSDKFVMLRSTIKLVWQSSELKRYKIHLVMFGHLTRFYEIGENKTDLAVTISLNLKFDQFIDL